MVRVHDCLGQPGGRLHLFFPYIIMLQLTIPPPEKAWDRNHPRGYTTAVNANSQNSSKSARVKKLSVK